jgi:predicted site-specific integrase-resolvase
MKQKYIKLSDYAKNKSIVYRTAWNRFKRGELIGAYSDESGHIYVPIEEHNNSNRCVIYGRVSSNDRKNSLNDQVKRLEEFANLKGFTIVKYYKEIASGMNDNRPILNKLIESNDWDILLIENKDRLTRFGFNYIKYLLSKLNKEIIVINNTDDNKEDLMKDLISVIYSFSARMYGLRRKKNKDEIIKFLEN